MFDPARDSIQVMTLHVSQGLEFQVVALVGAGRMSAEGEDEREEARLFYVGATRAMQRLVIGASENGRFTVRLQARARPDPDDSVTSTRTLGRSIRGGYAGDPAIRD